MWNPVGVDHPTNNGPRLLFADHHEEIEAACRALKAAIYTDDPANLIARFRTLERATLEHMSAEEEEILPAYEKTMPADASRILATHDELRRQLMRLAIDVELHAVRAHQLERLIATLREHARQEDLYMYAWAQIHLPLRTKRVLFKRIGRSLRALAQQRAAT